MRLINIDEVLQYLPDDLPYKGAVKRVLAQAPEAVVRCQDCIHSFVLGDSHLATEPPYKYYRKDCVICGCEELVGDYPIIVTDTFYCGYGRKDRINKIQEMEYIIEGKTSSQV